MEKFDVSTIDVEEVPATSSVLLGAAHHLGNYCKQDFTTFVQKRYAEKDPRKTIEEGKQVTACALAFFRKMREHCNAEFTAHWSCLDYNNQYYGNCRHTQRPYDECVLKHFGLKTDQPVHLTGEE